MTDNIPDEVREELYDIHAKTCKAMANKTRIKILDNLKRGEMRVDELAEALDTTAPNVSQHLSLLKEVGVVCKRQEKRYAFYSICDRRIVEACDLVKEVMLDRLQKREESLGRFSRYAEDFKRGK